MDQPLVSVIVPTYNRAYCLSHAIDSVLGQTHAHCEVVVVDDGSTDGTPQLIADRYGGNEKIRYLRKSNRGVASARNAGFAAAAGVYVALLDSDDTWKRWKIATQLACLEALPQVGMVWTDMEAVDPHGQLLEQRYLRKMYHAYRWFEDGGLFEQRAQLTALAPGCPDPGTATEVCWGDIFSEIVLGNLVHTSTVLLTRERLQQVGGFDERLRVTGEDYDFHLRTCRAGPVAYIDLPSISYQIGGADQLTHPSLTLQMAENFLKTIEPVIERDRARIRLPEHMIRAVLAEAHGWIGRELLKSGRVPEARRSLFRALRLAPRQTGSWLLLADSWLPQPASRLARRAYRRLHASEL